MKRTILAVVVAFLLTGRATFLIAAELQPINGCNAAPSCRANGFSVLKGNAGGHVLMLFGVGWNPVFHLDLITPPNSSDNLDPRLHLHAPPLPAPPGLAKPLLSTPGPMQFESDLERHEDERSGH
jgi:hypothetical protein